MLGCAGDTPTLEVLAARQILKDELPELKVRVVNVVDLMRLASNKHHPMEWMMKNMTNYLLKINQSYLTFMGTDLIHQLVYKRNNHDMHVHGYIEEGT